MKNKITPYTRLVNIVAIFIGALILLSACSGGKSKMPTELRNTKWELIAFLDRRGMRGPNINESSQIICFDQSSIYEFNLRTNEKQDENKLLYSSKESANSWILRFEGESLPTLYTLASEDTLIVQRRTYGDEWGERFQYAKFVFSVKDDVLSSGRQIGNASLQYSLRTGLNEVWFEVDPKTSEVQGPLKDYIRHLRSGVHSNGRQTIVIVGPGDRVNLGEAFRLYHPSIPQPTRFNAEGKDL